MDLATKNIDHGIKHGFWKLEDFEPNDNCIICHSKTNLFFISQIQRTLCSNHLKGLAIGLIQMLQVPIIND